MPYVNSSGQIAEQSWSPIKWIVSFFTFILLFFKTLFAPLASGTNPPNADRRAAFRGGGGGRDGRWPGGGGPGGGLNNRRVIGRLNGNSGVSCPPMAAGG